MQRNLITLSKRTLIFRGVLIRERGSISASGSGLGGPNLRCRGEVQIRCDMCPGTCVHEFCYKKPVLITRKHVNIEIKTYCYKRTA